MTILYIAIASIVYLLLGAGWAGENKDLDSYPTRTKEEAIIRYIISMFLWLPCEIIHIGTKIGRWGK